MNTPTFELDRSSAAFIATLGVDSYPCSFSSHAAVDLGN